MRLPRSQFKLWLPQLAVEFLEAVLSMFGCLSGSYRSLELGAVGGGDFGSGAVGVNGGKEVSTDLGRGGRAVVEGDLKLVSANDL